MVKDTVSLNQDKPMKFDAVICDIDGCLGPESTEPMDLDGLRQIRDWNQHAIEKRDRPIVTLCSGRPLPFAEAMCRIIGNSELPAICENGVWLFDPKSNEFLRDPAILPQHVHAVHEAQEWIERVFYPQGVVFQPGKSASISLWHPNTDFLRTLVPQLVEKFQAERWPFRVSMTVAWINCDLEFISKSSGLRRFIDRTGLAHSRLLGIGDSASDLAMRDYCSAFAGPLNAAPEVKNVADFIAKTSEIHGVIEILGQMCRSN